MNRFLIIVTFFVTNTSFSQKITQSTHIRVVDSLVRSIESQPLRRGLKCDSVPYVNDTEVNRCWSFYFDNSVGKMLSKFTVSFNGFTEWIYYYYDSKVIMIRRNKNVKGKAVLKWALYVHADEGFFIRGEMDRITVDNIESAYHFLKLSKEIAIKNTSR